MEVVYSKNGQPYSNSKTAVATHISCKLAGTHQGKAANLLPQACRQPLVICGLRGAGQQARKLAALGLDQPETPGCSYPGFPDFLHQGTAGFSSTRSAHGQGGCVALPSTRLLIR